MKILNNQYPYIDDVHTNEITQRYKPQCWEINPLDNRSYWYVEFKKSLHLLPTVIPNFILDKIISGDIVLVLSNSHEAFHEVADETYQHAILNLKIPEDHVILMSDSADIHTEVSQVAANYNLKEIKCVWHRNCEIGIKNFITHQSRESTYKTLEIKPYEKKFLNFNRRWRLHRPTLVALMQAMDILHLGHVSLGPSDDYQNWESIWGWMLSNHSDNAEIIDLLTVHKDRIVEIPPMYLDTNDLVTNRAELTQSTDYLYMDTYFSVITETNYYNFQPGRFLTEKIFKSIAKQHPFVVATVPHTLELLRSIGYKTFSPWIDESYDNEKNDSNRLLMIVKEIKRLSNLSPSELEEFLKAVKSICKYNLMVLLGKNTFIRNLN
jgi:hypothetical protein